MGKRLQRLAWLARVCSIFRQSTPDPFIVPVGGEPPLITARLSSGRVVRSPESGPLVAWLVRFYDRRIDENPKQVDYQTQSYSSVNADGTFEITVVIPGEYLAVVRGEWPAIKARPDPGDSFGGRT